MWKYTIGLLPILAFGLMGTMGGCEGKAPVVHMCKTYADVDTCKADTTCKWNDESGFCKAR